MGIKSTDKRKSAGFANKVLDGKMINFIDTTRTGGSRPRLSGVFDVPGASFVFYAPMSQSDDFGTNNVPIIFTADGNSSSSTLTGTSLSKGTNNGYYSLNNRSATPNSSYGTGGFTFDMGTTIGTGDFSIEFWADAVTPYTESNEGFFTLSNMYSYGSGSAYRIFVSSGTELLSTFSYGAWKHYCVTRVGGTLRVFIDGVYVNGSASTLNMTATTVRMLDYAASQFINTYMRKLRICIGAVPYGNSNSSFTPFPI